MSQAVDTPVQPPSLLVSVLTKIGAHAVTFIAGALATDGVIQTSQVSQLELIGASVVTWAIGFAWNEYQSWKHRRNADARVAVAAVTGKTS